MKFAVKAWSNGGFSAAQQLGDRDAVAAALYAEGAALFISPDILPSLPSPDFRALQFSPLHLPNIWVTLADEVPAWVSDKWNTYSVDRSVKWLDECVAMNPMGGEVFGAIVGGSSEQLRQYCAEEVAKRNVSGFWIGGFGFGESMDERPALLNAICDNLPEGKPRLTCGLDLLEEVLQGVAAGIDLFDSTYIHHIMNGGSVLIFPLGGIEAKIPTFETTDIGGCLSKINLRATVYRKDTTPIVEGCSCYTCRNYTKAYINRLLNVHEMLAQTLLKLHNTHCYLGFFRLIRESIKEGKFERFHKKFNSDRDVHWPALQYMHESYNVNRKLIT